MLFELQITNALYSLARSRLIQLRFTLRAFGKAGSLRFMQ